MARKGQQTVADPELEPFEMETAGTESGENTSTDADARTGENAAPRAYKRGPQLEWTRERQEALARVLKAPKAPGTIRTAQSVADALAQDPAFEGETLLDAGRVKSFIALTIKNREKEGRPVHAHLILDRARRVVVNLDLFDIEDETEAEAEGETEAEVVE